LEPSAWNFNRKQYFPLMPLERKIKPHKSRFAFRCCDTMVWLLGSAVRLACSRAAAASGGGGGGLSLTLSIQHKNSPETQAKRKAKKYKKKTNSKSPVPDICSLVLLLIQQQRTFFSFHHMECSSIVAIFH
jgi:hypothetical protein